jgi:putative transposase
VVASTETVCGTIQSAQAAAPARSGKVSRRRGIHRAWGNKYQATGKLWRDNWDRVIPFFDFPTEVRRVIYTTNAVERCT